MDFKTFPSGQSVVFQPYWAKDKTKGAEVYPNHPLKYGDMVLFLADIIPAYGHCIVTTYEGKVITMLHTNDFRAALEDEV